MIGPLCKTIGHYTLWKVHFPIRLCIFWFQTNFYWQSSVLLSSNTEAFTSQYDQCWVQANMEIETAWCPYLFNSTGNVHTTHEYTISPQLASLTLLSIQMGFRFLSWSRPILIGAKISYLIFHRRGQPASHHSKGVFFSLSLHPIIVYISYCDLVIMMINANMFYLYFWRDKDKEEEWRKENV